MEAKLKAEAEAKAKLEAEAKAKAEEQARLKLETEQKAKAEADAKVKLEAEAQAKAAAEAKAKADELEKAKATALAEADAKAKLAAESKQRAEAEAKATADAKAAQKAAADAAPARRVIAPGAAAPAMPAPAPAQAAAPAAATPAATASATAAAPAATATAAPAAATGDSAADRAEVEARVRAQVEAQVKVEVEARVRAEVDRQIASQKAAAAIATAKATQDLSIDPKANCPKPEKIAKNAKKKKKGAKVAALPAHCVADLALGDTAPAAAPVAAAAAAAPAAVRGDEPATSALADRKPALAAERKPVMIAEPPREEKPIALDRTAVADRAPAPAADRAPGVRVAAASPVAMPTFDARSGRPTASSGTSDVLVPRDEGGGRRSRRVRVSDDLLVGPVGLMVNTLRAGAEVVPESVTASFAYRALIDDASAVHHGFFVTAEGAQCEQSGPCGPRAWATVGFSPSADNTFGVARNVNGKHLIMADYLGWSSFSAEAGGQVRGASGLGGMIDVQLQNSSLSYRRNANLPTSTRTDVALQQLKLKAGGSLLRGGFELKLTVAGNAYLSDSPDKTSGMPMRGVFLDNDLGGLASGPQGLQAKVEGRYDFAFGLTAALSYGYLGYAGTEWANAHLIGAMLQQRLGRFDLGLGLTVQLDSPSVMPANASGADYAATYLSGRVAGTF